MGIIFGMASIIFMCSIVLTFASLVLSQRQEGMVVSVEKDKDPYSYLFNVYQD